MPATHWDLRYHSLFLFAFSFIALFAVSLVIAVDVSFIGFLLSHVFFFFAVLLSYSLLLTLFNSKTNPVFWALGPRPWVLDP